MVQLDIDVGKPLVRQDNCASADVSGIIGFSGDAVGELGAIFVEVGMEVKEAAKTAALAAAGVNR